MAKDNISIKDELEKTTEGINIKTILIDLIMLIISAAVTYLTFITCIFDAIVSYKLEKYMMHSEMIFILILILWIVVVYFLLSHIVKWCSKNK